MNLSEVSIPLGRRFRALKLWAVLRCYGRSGLQARSASTSGSRSSSKGWVREEPGWEVVAPRHFSLVCFRRDGSDEENERLLERVNGSGEVFLSHTRLDGRFVLRLAIGNFRTTEDDVRLAWDVLGARLRLSRRQRSDATKTRPAPAGPARGRRRPGPRR